MRRALDCLDERIRIAALFLVVGSAIVLYEVERPPSPPALTLAYWQQHVARNPDFGLAHSRLGLAFEGVGRIEAARAAYVRALELEPGLEEAAIGLNGVLRKTAGRRAAIEQLAAWSQSHPDCIACAYNLASDHLALGELELARPQIERALAEGGSASSPIYGSRDLQLEALLLAGRYHDARGDAAQAARYFEAALARQPESSAAHFQLGRLRLASEPAASLEHWRRLRELAPADPRGPLFEARARIATRDFEAAERALRAAEHLSAAAPDSDVDWAAEIDFERARAASEAGNPSAARAQLDQLLARHPELQRARELRARLDVERSD